MRQLWPLALCGFLGLLFTSKAEAWIPPDYEPFSTATQTTIAVATTTTVAVAAKSNRTFLILENISDTSMYCSIGKAAVANEGIRLYPNGGNLLLDAKYPTGAVHCLHEGDGTKSLLVTEGS